MARCRDETGDTEEASTLFNSWTLILKKEDVEVAYMSVSAAKVVSVIATVIVLASCNVNTSMPDIVICRYIRMEFCI